MYWLHSSVAFQATIAYTTRYSSRNVLTTFYIFTKLGMSDVKNAASKVLHFFRYDEKWCR